MKDRWTPIHAEGRAWRFMVSSRATAAVFRPPLENYWGAWERATNLTLIGFADARAAARWALRVEGES